MDAQRLRILREFADRGTVGETAEVLHLTPSAVSQQLKVLAREAGVELLAKRGRRIELTDAGRALVLRADEVLAAVARANEEMDVYRAGGHPRVRIASFPSGAGLLIPGIAAALDDSIDIDAADEDVPYADASALLADYDVVVTHRDERSPSLRSPRVRTQILMREPIDLVVPADHPLAGRKSVRLDDLGDQTWVSVPEGFPIDDVLVSMSVATGMRPLVRWRFKDFQVIEAMVAGGRGVALMPRFVARSPQVARLVIHGVRAARIYEVLTRPGADGRRSVSEVLQGLHTEAARVAGDQII